MILTIVLVVLALIAGTVFGAKMENWYQKDLAKQKQASEGDAHPVKFKTLPVTPKEALTLQSTDITRLEYLVGWVNGHLCKLNNETNFTDLTFLFKNENRKTIDAVLDLFRDTGWKIKEWERGYDKITFRFETSEKVRVKLDDVVKDEVEKVIEGSEDELAKKFEELERKQSHGQQKKV